MSDTQQGPEWWLASDGKWYPPQQATAAAPIQPAAPYPQAPFAQGPFAQGPFPPAGPPQGYPPMAPPGYQPFYGYGYVAGPTRTSGLAIASMVLGILWIYWIGSVLAVIFGHIALSQTKDPMVGGRGMAIAGVVLGWVGIGFFVLIAMFLSAL